MTVRPENPVSQDHAITFCKSLYRQDAPTQNLSNYLLVCMADQRPSTSAACAWRGHQIISSFESECANNVNGIRIAELSYFAAFDTYVSTTRNPNRVPDEKTASWSSGTSFDTLGWGPDGRVRGVYWVDVRPDGTDFTANGLCDVDGDGRTTLYTANKTTKAQLPAQPTETPQVVQAIKDANRTECGPMRTNLDNLGSAGVLLEMACQRMVEGSFFDDANAHLFLSCSADLNALAHSQQCHAARAWLGLSGSLIEQQNLREMRNECPTNIDAIKMAQIAYDAAFDTFVEINAYTPRSRPGKDAVAWQAGTRFDTLGWAPDGKVRGVYKVTSRGRTDFLVEAMCDVDGDGTPSYFTATKSVNTTRVTPEHLY